MKTNVITLAVALLLAAVITDQGQPSITTQPQHQTNIVSTTATFWVVATGTEPLAYQWQKLSSDWADLAGCTSSNLCLTNVQTSHAGDYRVVITNLDGAATSDVARLEVVVPPRIVATASFEHNAVDLSSNLTFTVSVAATPPLFYQWRFNGTNLMGQTNASLAVVAAKPANEGDYSVVVSNLAGAVTSEPARLWVVPPAAAFVKGNFTNALGRLPYFYFLPTNYNAARTYPLWFMFHGSPGDETVMTTPNYGVLGYFQYPALKTFASYRQQDRDPTIALWPTRRAGDASWTDTYLRQASAMLDQFITQFSVDTNRIFVMGMSEGVHAAWDLIAMRPGCFAGAGLAAGWPGSAPLASIKNVPVWACCAADDEYGQAAAVQGFVRNLRLAGGNPIYTEYGSGGHMIGIGVGLLTPALVDWFLTQRRGVAPNCEPLLAITHPTAQSILFTGATNLSLAGNAAAPECAVTQVTWTNYANNIKGIAVGTNVWSVSGIPLVANKTNIVVVVATTTSWAPAFGGNTTFNDTLTVILSPIRATLALQGNEALLNWTGGGPPYRVQRATDLLTGDWTDFLPNATPPVSLPVTGQVGFYRIVGQ